MEEETLNNLLFLVRLGLVTVLLWVASRGFDLWVSYRRRVADRDAFIRAIYAEVDFNTFDMTRFLDATVPVERLATLFENKDFVPHITDARHNDVYKSRINELHFVVAGQADDASLVGDLVRFYGELEKVVQQIEGLGKDSFKMISVPGKAATMAHIYNTCGACEQIGRKILSKMEVRFEHLRLSRNEAKEQVSGSNISELRQRLAALSSDLDRVDNNH